MTILWPQFAVALLLLWFPRRWLRAGGALLKRRRRSRPAPVVDGQDTVREPGDNSIIFREEFAKFRNYVDFFRAAIGGFAIMGGMADVQPALQAAAGDPDWRLVLVFCAKVAVLLTAVLVQSFRFETKANMFPPIFYLTGLTLGLCGFQVALFAIVLTWIINTTLPGPTSFLSIYALALAAFGMFLKFGDWPEISLAVGLVFSPVLISLLAKRRLVHFTKRVKTGG